MFSPTPSGPKKKSTFVCVFVMIVSVTYRLSVILIMCI
jgi:hypothetical protein